MNLKEALNQMLIIANDKLNHAKDKNRKWDINHYKNDIKIIKEQLKTL